MANFSGYSALDGFEEKEILELYSVSRRVSLGAGDTLVKQGDRKLLAFIVLRGELSIRREFRFVSREIAMLGEGEWGGACSLPDERGAVATAMAVCDTDVLVMDHLGLEALPLDMAMIIHERLGHYPNRMIRGLLLGHLNLSERVDYLSNYISSRRGELGDYSGSAIIDRIITSIPELPVYAGRLLSLLNDDSASGDEIVTLAKEDPAFAIKILQEINSAAYGLPRKVDDLHHAIMLLGFGTVHRLVVNQGIKQVLPDKPEFRELQSHSVATSHIVQAIARVIGEERHSTVCTIALLHDIGRSVLLLLMDANPDLELFVTLLDHAKLASLLLRKWGLPASIYIPVEKQMYPDFTPPEDLDENVRRDMAILYIAHRCDEYFQDTEIFESTGDYTSEYLRYLGIPEGNIPDFVNKRLIRELRKQKGYFGLPL